jgi:hypothetical protein
MANFVNDAARANKLVGSNPTQKSPRDFTALGAPGSLASSVSVRVSPESSWPAIGEAHSWQGTALFGLLDDFSVMLEVGLAPASMHLLSLPGQLHSLKRASLDRPSSEVS